MRTSRLWRPANQRKVVHTTINGYHLLVLANEDVGRQIHYLNRYEYPETAFLRKRIAMTDICVDIGANVGYFTMLMAQRAAAGRVHAFEPIPLNASLLRAGAELNGFDNISISQCAVGTVRGEVTFSQSSDSAYSSMIDTDRKPLDRVLTVPSTTLDAYIEREGLPRVDVLKADVEGAEELVITGAHDLLEDERRRPRIILMELYDDNLKAFGSSVHRIIGRLRRVGYRTFVLDEHGEPMAFDDELKTNHYNVVFQSPESNGRK